jgi:hypothetical protein
MWASPAMAIHEGAALATSPVLLAIAGGPACGKSSIAPDSSLLVQPRPQGLGSRLPCSKGGPRPAFINIPSRNIRLGGP